MWCDELWQMEWSQAQTQGTVPSPHAGHAGATIGNNFYIIGGGDNKSGIYNSSLLFLFSICGFMFCLRQGLVQIGLNFFNIHHV
jgi:hypothetical protein